MPVYKIKILFFCTYKMSLISSEVYKNGNFNFMAIKTTSEIWVSMKDIENGIGVKKHIWFSFRRNTWYL